MGDVVHEHVMPVRRTSASAPPFGTLCTKEPSQSYLNREVGNTIVYAAGWSSPSEGRAHKNASDDRNSSVSVCVIVA